MTSRRSFFLALALFICCLSAPARSAEPWETAALKGFTAMNQGDGKAFVEDAHPDYKEQMRSYMLDHLRTAPTSDEIHKVLKDFGLSSIDKMEKLPPEIFIQKLIHSMHVSMPAPLQTALEHAQVKVLSSEPDGDDYRVNVEMTLPVNGKSSTSKMILLVKKSGDAWKYNGTSK
jgi:hypothetical protein